MRIEPEAHGAGDPRLIREALARFEGFARGQAWTEEHAEAIARRRRELARICR